MASEAPPEQITDPTENQYLKKLKISKTTAGCLDCYNYFKFKNSALAKKSVEQALKYVKSSSDHKDAILVMSSFAEMAEEVVSQTERFKRMAKQMRSKMDLSLLHFQLSACDNLPFDQRDTYHVEAHSQILHCLQSSTQKTNLLKRFPQILKAWEFGLNNDLIILTKLKLEKDSIRMDYCKSDPYGVLDSGLVDMISSKEKAKSLIKYVLGLRNINIDYGLAIPQMKKKLIPAIKNAFGFSITEATKMINDMLAETMNWFCKLCQDQLKNVKASHFILEKILFFLAALFDNGFSESCADGCKQLKILEEKIFQGEGPCWDATRWTDFYSHSGVIHKSKRFTLMQTQSAVKRLMKNLKKFCEYDHFCRMVATFCQFLERLGDSATIDRLLVAIVDEKCLFYIKDKKYINDKPGEDFYHLVSFWLGNNKKTKNRWEVGAAQMDYFLLPQKPPEAPEPKQYEHIDNSQDYDGIMC